MIDLTHEIDFRDGAGYIQVPAPTNEAGIRFKFQFNSASPSASISSNAFIWNGWVAQRLMNYLEDGAKGVGRGITEGLPYRISLCGTGLQLNLKLDLQNQGTLWDCDEVQVPIMEAGRIDWFSKITENLNFWWLAQQGYITKADYKKTPYCLHTLPDGTQVAILTISEFMVIWQAFQLIRMITDFITKVGGDLATLPIGVGVVVADLIIAVSICTYAYFLINLFVQMAVDLKKNIIQSKKYKYCMREQDIWQKICSFANLQFQSNSIYAKGAIFENATYMPAKIVMPKQNLSILNAFDRPEDEENNPKSYGYPDETVGQWIKGMMDKYDAEITVDQGVLYFENRHYWNKTNPFQIPNTAKDGYTFNLPGPFRTNAFELSPSYLLRFSLDDSDQATTNKYRGTSCRVQLNHIIPGALDYQGWGQPKEVVLPFALAKRKDYLNEVEIVFDKILTGIAKIVNTIVAPINALIKLINKIIKLFGGNGFTIPTIKPLPTNPLQQRIGWMETSHDSFGLPKNFIGMQSGNDWVIDPLSEARNSAAGLMTYFHGKNLATRGAQYRLYDRNVFKLCCPDLIQISKSNVLVTPSGIFGKFEGETELVVKDNTAESVKYRLQQDWTKNLKEYIINDETI